MSRELLLLSLLHRQEMHGYQINEFLNRDLAACTDLKKPTAYFLLNKMAQQGWVTEEEVREGNRPPRRVYRLTPAGEAAFQELLHHNLSSHTPVYFDDDIGLVALEALLPQEARTLLEQRRGALAAALETAQAAPPHGGSLQWIVQHRIHHLASELAWTEELLEKLKHIEQGS